MKKILMTTLSISLLITTLQAEQITVKKLLENIENKYLIFKVDVNKIPECELYISKTIDIINSITNTKTETDIKICENKKEKTYKMKFNKETKIYSKNSLIDCNKEIFKNINFCINKNILYVKAIN